MDYFWQWLALGLALISLLLTVVNVVWMGRIARRTEYQLRALAQRESWQRRVEESAAP
jgi:hypothetical protein